MEEKADQYRDLLSLDAAHPIWERFYTIAPLVVIGTREGDHYDLAPKHLAFPMSWDNYFGFVCTPKHKTYQNVVRENAFSVSYPNPDQVVLASLTASPRCDEDPDKSVVNQIETFKAKKIDSLFVKDAYLHLECELYRIVDGFGLNSLITGRIIAAYINRDMLIVSGGDDQQMISKHPLLTYLYPGRFASVGETYAFPFPANFKK